MENTRVCSRCKVALPETSEHFASRFDRKTVQFQGVCRPCHKEYRKLHYENNKQKYIDKARVIQTKDRAWLKEYKQTLACENCGEARHWVLDFHHRDPTVKENEVSALFSGGKRKKALLEIEKCIVLCANCHRDFHYHESLKQAGDA